MKTHILLLTLFALLTFSAQAQVPKGGNLIGIHKVTTTEMNSITGMDTGNIVYNLDSSKYYYYNGSNWEQSSAPTISKVELIGDTLTIEQGDSSFKVDIGNNLSQSLTISGLGTTWNTNSGLNANITLNQAVTTLAITNTTAGSYGTLVVKQDATGARQLVLPSGSKVINGGLGIVLLTATPNAVDILSFYYDGTNYYWTIGHNFD